MIILLILKVRIILWLIMYMGDVVVVWGIICVPMIVLGPKRKGYKGWEIRKYRFYLGRKLLAGALILGPSPLLLIIPSPRNLMVDLLSIVRLLIFTGWVEQGDIPIKEWRWFSLRTNYSSTRHKKTRRLNLSQWKTNNT